MPFVIPGVMPGMPGVPVPTHSIPMGPTNVTMPIPVPLTPQFLNPQFGLMSMPGQASLSQSTQQGQQSQSPQAQPAQPQPLPVITEEEKELLEQIRARKRASEQPMSSKLSSPFSMAYSPPSMRKRKSLSDDPRKRTGSRSRSSRDGEADDLDLNALRLEDDAGDDSISPRPIMRSFPEIIVNMASSRSSTPGSHSASTSTPIWSESEQRLTPPSPHHLFHDP